MKPPLPGWLPGCRTREPYPGFRFKILGTKQTCIPFTTTGLTRTDCLTNRSTPRIVESFQMYAERVPDKSLIPHIQRLADTEIDILIEDRDYFVFVEAKNVQEGRKAKFENIGGVHQLVRQYLQGKLLEKMISKMFALATIGVNGGQECGNRVERPGGRDAEPCWRNGYQPQRGGSSLALNISGNQSPSPPASRSGRRAWQHGPTRWPSVCAAASLRRVCRFSRTRLTVQHGPALLRPTGSSSCRTVPPPARPGGGPRD